MGDSVAIIVARLEVWIKTVLAEIKNIHMKQDELKKDVAKNYKELSEKDTGQEILINEIISNRKNCDKNFDKIEQELKDHGDRLPNDRELEGQKGQRKKVENVWGKIKFFSGWAAGIIFILGVLGAIFAVLKYKT